MFCPKCGNKLMDDDVYCRKCGNKVRQSEPAPEVIQPIAPKPVRDTVPPAALTPEEIARRRAEAKKRNAKSTRNALLIILGVMLSFCFISCIGGLFIDSSDAPSDASASPSAKATATAKPTATPTRTPKPTPTPTPKPTTAANYKVTCSSVDQKDVARNPSDYEGKNIKVTGEVVQVEEGWFDNVTLRLRVGDSYDEWAYWLITYTRKSDTESRILEGDTITAYGVCNGVETYTTILGSTNTVPSMDAKYIDIE